MDIAYREVRAVRREDVAIVSRAKQARNESGLSIEEAARELGISAGYLSQIENGQRHVSAKRAEEISKLYKKKKEEIFLPSRYAIREVEGATTA